MKTRRVSALHFLEGAPLGGPVSGPFGPSPSSDLSRPLTPQPRAEAAWPRGLGLLRLPLLRRLLFLPVYSEAHADPTGGQEARPVHTLESVPPRTRVNSSFSICAPCSGPSAPGGPPPARGGDASQIPQHADFLLFSFQVLYWTGLVA